MPNDNNSQVQIIPSSYQKRIYEFVKNDTRSAAIIAVAGSGKTTTGVECSKLLLPPLRVAYVAFNKSVAEELKQRVPQHVDATTVHGLSFRALRKHLDSNRFTLDSKKTLRVLDRCMNEQTRALYGSAVRELVSLAKAHGIVPRNAPSLKGTTVGLMLDTEQNWANLIDRYDIEFEKDARPELAIDFARQTLEMSIAAAIEALLIDFDDQLYLPLIWQANFFQYDALLVDEAQDINPVQRAILKMSLRAGGRLLAFGDPCQSIYGFRGADTESIEAIKREFNAVELPLSVSYRCPQRVVGEARRFVSHIEPSETAPLGEVATLPAHWPDTFNESDAILCRNTAPLIVLAYRLLRRGKACRVLGRKIGEGLVALVKKMNADNIEELNQRLDRHLEREVQKFLAKGQEEKADALADRVVTVRIFIDQLPEDDRRVARLIQIISDLFTDNNKGILTLCTIHKAKGLEWPRVFILDPELMPSKWARQSWQVQQEVNCQYVAVTRAKQSLFYISSRTWRDSAPAQEAR